MTSRASISSLIRIAPSCAVAPAPMVADSATAVVPGAINRTLTKADAKPVSASTPTDAGKRVVPDAQAERHGVRHSRDRGRRALHARIASERRHLTALRSRPVMARPTAMIDARRQELDALTDRAHRRVLAAVQEREELMSTAFDNGVAIRTRGTPCPTRSASLSSHSAAPARGFRSAPRTAG